VIAVLQRVSRAKVHVAGSVVGAIDDGLLVLLGVLAGDSEAEAERLAERTATFRVFEDAEGRMNRSVVDVGGAVLVVSQFTLAADGRKGRRPSFDRAAPPAEAEPLYERFAAALARRGLRVATGVFGAKMDVESTNRGPATFVLTEAPPAA
jgi:D-tyrosyl-tRNA(Tyr) deacylase